MANLYIDTDSDSRFGFVFEMTYFGAIPKSASTNKCVMTVFDQETSEIVVKIERTYKGDLRFDAVADRTRDLFDVETGRMR